MSATVTYDPRLVAALRPAVLELPDPAENQELREVVLTIARELVAQGASAGTVHGTINGQAWAISCALSRDAAPSVDPSQRCTRVRELVGDWIGELWPDGILPRPRGTR